MFRALPVERINQSLSPGWNLDEEEVVRRRAQYGANDVVEKRRNAWLGLLTDTLLDPMIWFLVAASFLFAILSKYTSAIILLLAIIPIGGMDAFLHWRTQVSTQALSSRLIAYARVIRDGRERMIEARDIVPGDLVLVKGGEYFAADGVIISAENAQVDESSLTGEAFPVSKQALAAIPAGSAQPLISYTYWGLVGTRLLTGSTLVRVVYTGKETIYGEIVSSVLKTQQEMTPLQHALARLVFILIVVASGFCILLALVRFYQGFGLVDAILSAATLAVVALPDEFPMTFTFFLGVGVYRLAKKHALVKRAVSVENIGRVSCICTDKTGTITEGRFRVAVSTPAQSVMQADLLLCAKLASRADSGDPLDAAIIDVAKDLPAAGYESKQVYPFTEERKRETSCYQLDRQFYFATKGAPEVLLNICTLASGQEDYWREQVNQLARQGYKVIACARLLLPAQNAALAEPDRNYEFMGVLAFEDPPRQEVFAAVRQCRRGGIRVLMITGDHPSTAKKIAADIGLGEGAPNVITAGKAELLLRKGGGEFLRHVDVIARAVPSQKFAVVNALRDLDEIVAVTGDGVNDVPALRAADVGIAMGERGMQSAREAASIVLLDDNFGSIVNAVSEGKQLFRNLQLSFKYLLLVHTPYVLSATLIPLMGFPLLYYPIHIVCIELFIHPTCMLVFQNLPGEMPAAVSSAAKRRISFFNPYDWWGMGILGLYSTLIVMSAYLMSLYLTGNDMIARANAFLAVGLAHIAFTLGLSRLQSLTARIIVIVSLAALLLLVQVPVIANYFNMQPPSLATWGVLVFLSTVTAWLTRKFA
ncbi:Calcium-transporting ATPase 1 [Aquicella siphonis]|uniref:Calcium-transporting ATPase 1 n=1 Tax=Aquicella siphonis TaxID=254247 RepID=A0A5E4PF47_9COXI|nr:cation-transporting P-type ATPase [Aquicella siphonis]VVC75235.1 Calcium-transporting ATPase 1 [Aquicella siphonis]